jgi:hypothetical protein
VDEQLDLVEVYEGVVAERAQEAEQLQQELARAELQLELERIWNRIFGSQVAALRVLDAAPQGLTRQALEPIYEDARARRGLALTFDQWMTFLLRDGLGGSLVELAPQGTYHIGQKGQALLGYGDVSGYGNMLRPH